MATAGLAWACELGGFRERHVGAGRTAVGPRATGGRARAWGWAMVRAGAWGAGIGVGKGYGDG